MVINSAMAILHVIEPNEQEIEGIKKNQEFKRMENLELWVKGETRKAMVN